MLTAELMPVNENVNEPPDERLIERSFSFWVGLVFVKSLKTNEFRYIYKS